ncbi:MAG TPA: cytochrome d ubiquinol oxidase subunit II [Gaiellaceae bacterium]|nr:cytochrome d ubiquinol oxidase subunit II [Gaiellaceae bacterium]
MALYNWPLVFVLIGLALYLILAGSDFGAGFWQLTAGGGEHGEEVREHAHRASAPVWEANHVWLIFVLTVMWTAYPVAFGSIAATLAIPLFLAGIGIVLRGGAYVVSSGTPTPRMQSAVDTIFSVSSILTPFFLGTVIGALASERVRVGNPGGSLFTSWLNPTSIAIGILAVASGAYTAAVFLAGDARRYGDEHLVASFRRRALGAGVAAGAVAIGALVVLHFDAGRLFNRLTHGPGLPGLVVSLLAGASTLALLLRGRYEPARYTASLAVAATIAGFALAQSPVLLADLSVEQAAAGHDTLVLVVVAVLGGAAILFPSLVFLFRLALQGQLEDAGPDRTPPAGGHAAAGMHVNRLAFRLAVALLIGGIGCLTIADAAWLHTIGVVCWLGFVASGFVAVSPGNAGEPVA